MATDPIPFESLDDLRAEHGRLLRLSKDPAGPAGDVVGQVVQFLGRTRATGTRLDAPADREAAQSILDYWTATLFTLPNGLSAANALPAAIPGVLPGAVNLQLLPFAAATLDRAAAAADAWLANQPLDDRVLARRTVLRLTRVHPDKDTFDAVPTVRAGLYDLDTPDRVNAVVSGLATAGVIRVTPGDSDDMDRVALRSPELLKPQTWKTLAGWQADRLRFRAAATSWDRANRPTDLLSVDDPVDAAAGLEEARRYHDRNKVERDYVNASAYRQVRKLEQAKADRRAKLWWRGLALAAVLGWVGTAVGWYLVAMGTREVRNLNKELRARNDKLTAVSTQLADKNKALVAESAARKTAQTEQRKAEDRLNSQNRGRVRWLAAMQLSRALGEVASSRTRPERELAATRLDLVITQLEETGAIELPPDSKRVLADVKTKAKTWDGPADERGELAIRVLAICRYMRNEALTDPDMRAYAVIVRRVPYQMVVQATETILKQLRGREPADHSAPFVREFWTLYWGEMVMFEGQPVEGAMVKFGNALRQIGDKQKDAISTADLRTALAGLGTSPARLDQLAKELRVRGGDSEVLYAVVRDAQKPKYTDADLDALEAARTKLVQALRGELDNNRMELPVGAAVPLAR